VPGVLLVIGCLIPICHQEQALDEDEAVRLVVEVVEELNLLSEHAHTYNFRLFPSPRKELTLVLEKKALLASLRLS
jgi:hypothetical protein